jgi:hypothetical protein
MSSTMIMQTEEAKDRAVTLRNRARLGANKNLLFWYRELYRDQFRDLPNPASLSILEIGSGISPLKQFLSNVVTSDVLDLDYLDLVFDCQEIDRLDAIKDNSLDVITLTNVLHSPEKSNCVSEPRGQQVEIRRQGYCDRALFFNRINSHPQIFASRVGRFPDCRAGTGLCGRTTGIRQHCIAVANLFPETRLAATLE